jgi:uncharacterized protein (DUF2384 family)
MYAAMPWQRRDMALRGVPADSVLELAGLLDIPLEVLSRALGIAPVTVRRKAKNHELLTLDQAERVLGLQRIVGFVVWMVEYCGDATNFNAGRWTGRWLTAGQPALGGVLAIQYLDTIAGHEALLELLGKNVSGTYA